MIEQCCEYLSRQFIWLYVLVMSHTCFRVNPHSLVAWVSRSSSSIIWAVRLNGSVFVYKLSGCWFESSCSHLNFRFCTCSKQRVPWHSGDYRVWIDPKTNVDWLLNAYVTWQEQTVKCTVQMITHRTAHSFGQFGLASLVECLFTN